mgnify:CR=1 FL=1
MASVGRRSFPYLPTRNWWDLRRRFQTAVPREIDARYLGTVFGISEEAAKNLVPPLRAIGLIDDAGKPTERAIAWRDDEHYREVCQSIIADIYPDALVDAVPPADATRESAQRWFARETQTGEGAARKMAGFYLLLAEGDPAGATATADRQARTDGDGRKPRRTEAKLADAPARRVAGARSPAVVSPEAPPATDTGLPGLHVDVQVHIDSSASPEQIDLIFRSMAKYLYGRE